MTSLRTVFLFFALTMPAVAAAQYVGIQNYLIVFLFFINDYIIPLLFTLAFLFFLINAIRYFIIGGGNEESRESARRLALWGVLAFVIMLSIWGLTNVIVNGLNIGQTQGVCPDYIGNCN